MAELNDPQVGKWCNEQVRTVADQYSSLWASCRELRATYDAQNIAAKLGANDALLVTDGSETDGRPRASVGAVKTLVSNADAFVANAEAGGKAILNVFLGLAPQPL